MKSFLNFFLPTVLLLQSASVFSSDFANAFGHKHSIPPLQVMTQNEEIVNRLLREFKLPEALSFDNSRNLLGAAFNENGLIERIVFFGRHGRVDYVGEKLGILSARCLTNIDAFGDMVQRELSLSSMGFFEIKQNETEFFAELLAEVPEHISNSTSSDGVFFLPSNGMICNVPRFIAHELTTEIRAIRPAK